MDLRHKHWALIFVGILVAILAFIIAWYMLGSHTVFAPTTGVSSSTPNVATTTAASSITEHATYYDIDLAYPSVTPLASVSAEANAKAIASMKAAMQVTADQFVKDGNFANLSHDDIQMMELDQRKETLGAQYKKYSGTRTVSYVFEIYEDTHGAHPNAFYKTFTFDTKTGAELSLSSIFDSGNPYAILSSISEGLLPAIIAAREQVKVSEVDQDYIKSGVSPEPKNFENWYLSGKKLVVIFPPYQVGPYALGTVELPIPLSAFLADLAARDDEDVRVLLRRAGLLTLAGRLAPHGLRATETTALRPSPPPCGWSTGFMAVPRTVGRMPFQRERPALP
jgi:hypothetical protein